MHVVLYTECVLQRRRCAFSRPEMPPGPGGGRRVLADAYYKPPLYYLCYR